ncbi:FAD-dependent oxidoreductase [Thiomonas sp.]|jgi:sulfide:quinone oxidoreductase|uniref:NAD(P)/FAD-dependent oxidoreductase n=1 Tax=Thiomonas sp. TaxID=2047785 RepID=UPI002627EC8D|nr:FAD-dependent oxidoreductase [Thiomonas sp.]
MTSHFVVLGAGFAALTAARTLRDKDPQARITLVAPKAEFVYLPSLIWVPTGVRKSSELTIDLAPFLRRMRIDFVAGEVTGLQDGGRTVLTTAGPVDNDGLIIATGGRFIKKLPGIEHAIALCEGVAAAEKIRERLLAMDSGRIACGFGGNPQEPVAVRGGPMFELLFGIDTWLRRQRKRDRVELVFFNASDKPGQRLGEKAVTGLLSHMARRRIDTHLGHKPLRFTAEGVETEGGFVRADLILFMPGLTGPGWLHNTELPRSAGGFIQADAHCAVPGFDRVFVAGDAGSFPGPDWLPKQAHMADLQAKAAAANLLLAMQDKPAAHVPKAELVCIVDTVDSGILVFRDENKTVVLPPSRAFTWAKRWFEGKYLKEYRTA